MKNKYENMNNFLFSKTGEGEEQPIGEYANRKTGRVVVLYPCAKE